MIKKVLVVDDNRISRELIQEVLSSSEQQVVEAENGEDALKMIVNEKPDVVLLDIQLPVYDGYEVLRRIRSDLGLEKLPVIALTAYAMEQDHEKAVAAGFDDYITKPVDGGALRARIKEILNNRV
ncbi:MAG: response regulator [Acidobacteriota bacterium]|jgi:CheY-like chemotaxis protein